MRMSRKFQCLLSFVFCTVTLTFIGSCTAIFDNLLFSCSLICNPPSQEEKIAYEIVKDLTHNWKTRYGLNFSGWGGTRDDSKRKTIEIWLITRKVLSKDEGRILLLECIEEALLAFNSCSKYREFMADYPFTGKNMHIDIVVQPQKGLTASYPDICMFGYYNGKLVFLTKSPDKPFGFHTQEEEAHEEAVTAPSKSQK